MSDVLKLVLNSELRGMDIRSTECTDPAYVRFINKTGRPLDVVWFNYGGKLVLYGTLDSQQFLDVDTFKTHPWMFIDKTTGKQMQVGSGKIFYPISWREILLRHRSINLAIKSRVQVAVSLPMFTLREITMQVIMKHLEGKKDVESLELPSGLLEELKFMIWNKEHFQLLYE